MSVIVTTPLGTFRRLPTSQGLVWVMECAVCGGFEKLAPEQLAGRVSVNHAATGCPSRYHETHDYAAAIREALKDHAGQVDLTTSRGLRSMSGAYPQICGPE